MPDVSFSALLVVLLVAFLTPLLLAAGPSLKLSEPVLLIVAGIVLGPSALGVVSSDIIVNVLALIGLAFLLFLAGAEIDLSKLRGVRGRAVARGFATSAALAFGVGLLLDAIGLVQAPALVAITLLSTALGVLVPVLKSSGLIEGEAGQLIIAGASAADFGTVILLSLLFSQESIGTGARVVLLVVFLALALVGGVAVMRFERSRRIDKIFTALQDTTAQIRVRFAMVLLIALVALAEELGLEVILGAFVAGALMRALDREHLMTHPHFQLKLEAIGFGLFIPIFFVSSGINLDVGSLAESGSALALVPIFVASLLLVRGLPAIVYRRLIHGRELVAAAFLQATSLPFILAATQIGVALRVLKESTAAAFVAAGVVSVLVFPLVGVSLLRAPRA
jgi:Kef-type K+ transport system membrane component KefB